MKTKTPRGFAALTARHRQQLSSRGGVAVHQHGTGHEWTSAEAREQGRKGGLVSAQRRAARKAAGGTP